MTKQPPANTELIDRARLYLINWRCNDTDNRTENEVLADLISSEIAPCLRLLTEITTAHRDENSCDYNDCDKDLCQFCEDVAKIASQQSKRLTKVQKKSND